MIVNNGELTGDTEQTCETDCLQEFHLIHEARDGSGEAVAVLIEKFRGYLLNVAKTAISPAVQQKVSASDLYQESFLAAERGFGDFRGETLPELRAWLKQIMVRQATEARRYYTQTAKRRVSREIPLEAGYCSEEVSARDTSSSDRFISDDEAELVRDAVASLPPAYREVIMLHNHEGLALFGSVQYEVTEMVINLLRNWSL